MKTLITDFISALTDASKELEVKTAETEKQFVEAYTKLKESNEKLVKTVNELAVLYDLIEDVLNVFDDISYTQNQILAPLADLKFENDRLFLFPDGGAEEEDNEE